MQEKASKEDQPPKSTAKMPSFMGEFGGDCSSVGGGLGTIGSRKESGGSAQNPIGPAKSRRLTIVAFSTNQTGSQEASLPSRASNPAHAK